MSAYRSDEDLRGFGKRLRHATPPFLEVRVNHIEEVRAGDIAVGLGERRRRRVPNLLKIREELAQQPAAKACCTTRLKVTFAL